MLLFFNPIHIDLVYRCGYVDRFGLIT